MGVCPITLAKFVGTFSLGLLTGTSYALSRIVLPTLSSLPSSSSASQALTTLQNLSTRTSLTLASISSLSLVTAFTLASRRNRHPYLLWTALAALLAGQGIELFYNGTDRILAAARFRRDGALCSHAPAQTESTSERGRAKLSQNDSFVEISRDQSSATDRSALTPSGSESDEREVVNGEKVELEMRREKKTQLARTAVGAIGFMMGVVGIWGDGA